MPKAIILRGLPGTGKSTKARDWAKELDDPIVLELDNYLIDKDTGEYLYSPGGKCVAQDQLYVDFITALYERRDIIFDDINIKVEDFIYHYKAAKAVGYDVEVHKTTPDEVWVLVARNKHNVPEDEIIRMINEWEEFDE